MQISGSNTTFEWPRWSHLHRYGRDDKASCQSPFRWNKECCGSCYPTVLWHRYAITLEQARFTNPVKLHKQEYYCGTEMVEISRNSRSTWTDGTDRHESTIGHEARPGQDMCTRWTHGSKISSRMQRLPKGYYAISPCRRLS